MRIILEIETLFPTICGQCDEEYCNKFESPTSPVLRCFLCFQGSHICEQTTQVAANLHASPTALPHGTVWLCKLCLTQNNPVPSKRSKSNRHRYPSTASVAVSTHLSQTATPNENKQTDIDADELSKKLDVVYRQQQQQTAIKPSEDDTICVDYTMEKIPHGISGRTLHQGKTTCSKLHPKRCKKFTRFGTDSNGGCTLGSECQLYHPKHCKNSVQHKQCFKKQCTLVHLVGTKRVKPSKDKDTRKKDGKHPGGESRPDRGSYRHTESTSAANEPSEKTTGNSQHSTSFLGIQNLLKVMQANFQSEIISLKNQIAGQESKFSSFFPTANQTPHFQMFPHPFPTVSQMTHTPTFPHLPPALQHLNPTPVPQWARFHQHSC